MLRVPLRNGLPRNRLTRMKSSNSIRSSFIEYFVENHGHKHVKSSSVVPLCDPTVPFVNAGMNQFKGVFLGNVQPPCPRAVNSQKCVRVGGKHNDLDVVGTDGHHHTFFEMLGNWSFGDYYKKEACQMAWDLLLGPYRLKPEDLVVTYFSGDVVMNISEDRECRDIWRAIGVQDSRLKALGAADNFWEMGVTGPCGPCTEIHYVNPDGTLTEIWNIVFIQCNREGDGSVRGLSRQHVDTGLGLERLAALLQGARSNYDTDLFRPIIDAIQKSSPSVPAYTGDYSPNAVLDSAYRRLADHARMISVCLADGVFPATSLNLKQIMRKSFKISTDIFKNPRLLHILYDEVAQSLGSTYPELISKVSDSKLIIDHEAEAYRKMRVDMSKKWKELEKKYPEVGALSDVESAGLVLGYKEFKQTMSKHKTTEIPGELVFKLYDTHGIQEDLIQKIAELNNMTIDKKGFWKLLSNHKTRHKTAFKEQTANKATLFNQAIKKLIDNGVNSTNDSFKYEYETKDDKIVFEPLKTKLVAILNEDCEWIDCLEPCEDRPYYLVTKDTNFYCEEGGQIADDGIIRINKKVTMKVDSVFKIRDFVFHKGYLVVSDTEYNYVKCDSEVVLEVNNVKRLNLMRNHTGVHLLNAAIRKVLPNSVVCPIGSKVTDKGLSLNLTVYGDKLSQKVILDAQDLIRESIKSNARVETRIVDSIELTKESSVVTIPGETYPETGLRLVTVQAPLLSKELCCGTHVPAPRWLRDLAVTSVKGAASHAPTVHALTGDSAVEARELFCRAEKLEQVIELIDPERLKEEVALIKQALAELCGTAGAAYGDYARCLALLDSLQKQEVIKNEMALQTIAETEVRDAETSALAAGRGFVVHFVRCSYLMPSESVGRVLGACAPAAPALLLGCAGGVVVAVSSVPQELVSDGFSASKWLSSIVSVFGADVAPAQSGRALDTYAQMTAVNVSLITCEQLVQDAMRVAIQFAKRHAADTTPTHAQPKTTRRHN